MFREALLESSPVARRRKAWPMATAFSLEMIIAGVLVLLPLISTGVLPLSARVSPPKYTPLTQMEVKPMQTAHGGVRNPVNTPAYRVVQVANGNPALVDPFMKNVLTEISDQPVNPHLNVGPPNGDGMPDITPGRTAPPKPPARLIISHPSEAMLLVKVVPDYPNVAKIAGVQGDVKLHAIIAKDGTIQSLSVTSGPDMLREAALKAVEQWRYRPYTLNGQAVEVETVITVSFKRF